MADTAGNLPESKRILRSMKMKGLLFSCIAGVVLCLGYYVFDPDHGWERIKALALFFFAFAPIWMGFMNANAANAVKSLLRIVDRTETTELSADEVRHLVECVIKAPWMLSVSSSMAWIGLAPLCFLLAEHYTDGPKHSYLEWLLTILIWVPPLFLSNLYRIEALLRPYIYRYVPESMLKTVSSPYTFTIQKRVFIVFVLLGPYLMCCYTGLMQLKLNNARSLEQAVQGSLSVELFFVFLSCLAAAVLGVFFLNAVEKPLRQIVSVLEDDSVEIRPDSIDEFGIMTGLLSERRKLERSKQEFIALISHELRSPLMSMQGFLKILANGGYGQVPELVIKKANLGDRNCMRLVKLINDLLDIEKLQSGRFECIFEDTDSSSIIERAVQAVRELADESKVLLVIECQDLRVWADEDRMVQVMVNLISNAIKHSGGQPVVVSAQPKEDGIEFGVKDAGAGVPENLKDVIFERFKQLPDDVKSRKGTGLGLPIAKALVSEHKGDIGVQSAQEGGSYFWVKLPLPEAAAEA
jgi:signal transduction histidine kinase